MNMRAFLKWLMASSSDNSHNNYLNNCNSTGRISRETIYRPGSDAGNLLYYYSITLTRIYTWKRLPLIFLSTHHCLVLTLLTTILPEVLLKEVLKMPVPDWLLWFKITSLVIVLSLGFWVSTLRPLQKYSLVLAALLLLEYGSALLRNTLWWKMLFPGSGFIASMTSQQILRVLSALIMVGLLLYCSKNFPPSF